MLGETFFQSARMVAIIVTLICSTVVLGLAGNFANEFLPHLRGKDGRDEIPMFLRAVASTVPYTIFSLCVPAVTIVVFLIILNGSQPRIDLFIFFVLDVLWLTTAAWTSDIIGPVECFPLTGREPIKNGGTISEQTYCNEMKVIEAFSWGLFAILLICFITLLILIMRVVASGRYGAWAEPIQEIPWFGQIPYGNMYYGGGAMPQQMYGGGMPYGGQQYAAQQVMPQGGGMAPYVVQQMPGHSVVIQPSPNGGAPTFNQVPSNMQPV